MQIKKVLYILFLATFLLLNFNLTFAENEITITQFPESPKEDEFVSYNIQSQNYNLSEYTIIWAVNGTVQDEGIGRTTFRYKTPKQGKEVIISVILVISENDIKTANVTLKPFPFFILFEGKDSYTPAFYKGRALPSKEGISRIGLITLEKNISTKWSVDNKLNKNSLDKIFLYKNSLTENTLPVSVEILKDGSFFSKINRNITLKKPELIVYKTNNTLLSEMQNTESDNDISIIIEPFFFSADKKNSTNLVYTWSVNGQMKDLKNPWSIKLSSKNPESISLKVSLENKEKITQSDEKTFFIQLK